MSITPLISIGLQRHRASVTEENEAQYYLQGEVANLESMPSQSFSLWRGRLQATSESCCIWKGLEDNWGLLSTIPDLCMIVGVGRATGRWFSRSQVEVKHLTSIDFHWELGIWLSFVPLKISPIRLIGSSLRSSLLQHMLPPWLSDYAQRPCKWIYKTLAENNSHCTGSPGQKYTSLSRLSSSKMFASGKPSSHLFSQ